MLDVAASNEPEALEAPLSGHPGAGWLLAAPPLGEAKVRVVWEVPELALPRDDGTWEYRLRWMGLPAHVGDVVNLSFTRSDGWAWHGEGPPGRVELVDELRGSWLFAPIGHHRPVSAARGGEQLGEKTG